MVSLGPGLRCYYDLPNTEEKEDLVDWSVLKEMNVEEVLNLLDICISYKYLAN